MIKKLLLLLIKIYQKIISPIFGQSKCRFHPSCSAYSKQAIEEHGVIKGLFLSIKRVLRCNPFFQHGYDPVPKPVKRKNIEANNGRS